MFSLENIFLAGIDSPIGLLFSFVTLIDLYAYLGPCQEIGLGFLKKVCVMYMFNLSLFIDQIYWYQTAAHIFLLVTGNFFNKYYW